ncbi:hypothetical protein WJX84_004340 [Apatococcus fuscideae]|uniref:Non-specific serine/threonine protein kinase n=1 Tax=Apatococcus fuscideae TaxID=2026836 RepID=A0AAW1TAT3_9CHLO
MQASVSSAGPGPAACLGLHRLPFRPYRRASSRLQTRAQLSNKGQKHRAEQLSILRELGQGAYGQVFEGTLQTPRGKDRVVLKRVKAKVEAAETMGQMEHLLNVYAARAAPQSVAHFLGYIEVTATQATKALTEGLWLMWRYEGSQTLWSYMRRTSLFRDECLTALAADLCLPEPVAVATVIQQLCENLSAMHAAGLVHRDVKPANIIFAEQEKRFKLIDLGACADLRAGTNYIPDEGIMDPSYCPPEQYCLPTDSPDLARQFGVVRSAMSPMLWSRYKPDRFDSWSTGMVLLQLAIPRLRQMESLRDFTKLLKREDCDIYAAVKAARLPAKQTALLEAEQGAGWDLLAGLLRPRSVQVMDDGGVRFVNTKSKAIRLPVSAALLHPYLRQAADTSTKRGKTAASGGFTQSVQDLERTLSGAQASAPDAGAFSNALGFWKRTAGQLFLLEKKLVNQAAAVEFQTTQVTRLKRLGARSADLQRAQSLLDKMQGRLTGLQKEFSATASSAQSILGGILGSQGNSPLPAAVGSQRQPSSRPLQAPKASTAGSATSVSPADGSSRQQLNQAATNMVVGGLKFTGLALNIATDLARSLSTEAAASVAKIDAEVTAQRQGQAATKAFLGLLQSANPAITSQTSWKEVQARMGSHPVFEAVPAHQRQEIVQTYQRAVGKLEAARQQRAAAAFQELLDTSHQQPDMTWLEFQRQHGSNPILRGLSDEAGLRLFKRHSSALAAAAAKQQASEEAASAFKKLLSQLWPALTSASAWASVKPQIQNDNRYKGIQEAQRQSIFQSYIHELTQVERASVEVAEAVVDTPPGSAELQALRAEQARMKAEYERMEAKLKEMEARLSLKDQTKQPARKINSNHTASHPWYGEHTLCLLSWCP